MDYLSILVNDVLKIILSYCGQPTETILHNVNKRLKSITSVNTSSLTFELAIKMKSIYYTQILLQSGYYFNIFDYVYNICKTNDINFVECIVGINKFAKLVATHRPYLLKKMSTEFLCRLYDKMEDKEIIKILLCNHMCDVVLSIRENSSNKSEFDKIILSIIHRTTIINYTFLKYLQGIMLPIKFGVTQQIVRFAIAKGCLEFVEWCFENASEEIINATLMYINKYDICSSDKNVILWMYDQGYFISYNIIQSFICNGIIENLSDLSYIYKIGQGRTNYYPNKCTVWEKCKTIDQEIEQIKKFDAVTNKIIIHYASINNFYLIDNYTNDSDLYKLIYYCLIYDNLSVFNKEVFLKYDVNELRIVLKLDSEYPMICVKRYIDLIEQRSNEFCKYYIDGILEKFNYDILVKYVSINNNYEPYIDIYEKKGLDFCLKLIVSIKNIYKFMPICSSEKIDKRLCETNCMELIAFRLHDGITSNFGKFIIRYSSIECIKSTILKKYFIKHNTKSLMKQALMYRNKEVVEYLLSIDGTFIEENILDAFSNCVAAADWLLGNKNYKYSFNLNRVMYMIYENEDHRTLFCNWVVSKNPSYENTSLTMSIRYDNLPIFKYLTKDKKIPQYCIIAAKDYKAIKILKYIDSCMNV